MKHTLCEECKTLVFYEGAKVPKLCPQHEIVPLDFRRKPIYQNEARPRGRGLPRGAVVRDN